MDYLTILAVAVGLSFDTFAVSLSYGVVRFKILFLQALRVAIILAIVQGGLTIIGYFIGTIVSNPLKKADHWIALGLLSFLGVKMIIEGMKEEHRRDMNDYSRLIVIFTIALGTSIDAFAVGVSFGLLDIKIWLAGLIIALVTFLASMIAIRLGKSAGKNLGQHVEIIGGIILIGIGIKIFLEHLLSS
jgi:putative Mn2+ efflux pump MntP